MKLSEPMLQRQENHGEPDSHFAPLLRRLETDNLQEREAAENELRIALEREIRSGTKHSRIRSGLLILFFGFLMPAQFPLIVLHMLGIPGMVGLICAMFICLGALFFNRSIQTRAAKRLVGLQDPRAVGPLLDMLVASSNIRWEEVRTALIRLLPRLRASDEPFLTAHHLTTLTYLLRQPGMWYNRPDKSGTDLRVEILKALAQVGDEQAISTVEELAANAKSEAVRQAALECLPILKARVEEGRPGRTLLRPAHSEDDPGLSLLRPASGNHNPDTEELLRPAARDV
jgi:HEAT repeat protein